MNPHEAEKRDIDFPVLTISAFVDSETAVIIGHRIHDISQGEELLVLGIGNTIVPGTNIPLVVPKRSLEVTATMGQYVLAKGPRRTVNVNPLASALDQFKPRQVLERPELSADEKSFLGNPGRGPITKDDIVVRKSDLSAYVQALADIKNE